MTKTKVRRKVRGGSDDVCWLNKIHFVGKDPLRNINYWGQSCNRNIKGVHLFLPFIQHRAAGVHVIVICKMISGDSMKPWTAENTWKDCNRL